MVALALPERRAMGDEATALDSNGRTMPAKPLDVGLEVSYDEYPRIEEAFQQFLDDSLHPRVPDSLFDVLSSLELPANGLAVDVGCGEGRDSIELAGRFGLHVHGVDPVPRHIEESSARASAEGFSERASFSVGTAEELPVADKTVDLVWCKEVLMFADLGRAFGEFVRVLRPSGVGFVYQVLTGPGMNDAEAREFWEGDLGYGSAHSVRPSDIEAAIASVGLELRSRIDFGSEWGEFAQERSGAGGRRLVHAARLLRDPQRYTTAFGEAAYRIMLADCLWHIYRMIGKLHGAAFIFTRPRTSAQSNAC
jgi:SAM-dependent methyltransferase